MKLERLQKLKNYIEELKTNEFKKVESTSFLQAEAYDCYLNNGHIIRREKLVKGGKDGSAAIILPITLENKIILAIEPRVFTKETVGIDLPAGYIEDGEDPIIAANRELKEETGYLASTMIPIGSYYQDQGCSAAYNHYFVALNCKKVSSQNLDEGEFIKYILVTKDELEYLVNNGYIKGINSAYAIEKGKQYIKRKKDLYV